MTTEQKARAYDEALEDMRVIYPNLKGDARLAVEHAFPELTESDDERIRKEIIKFIQDFCNPCDTDCDKWIAYLEKQKDINCLACDQHLKGYLAGRKVTEEEKQKEQKPAEWSEEDEKMLKSKYKHKDSLPEDASCVYDTNKLTPTPSVNIEDVARVQFASHAKVFDKKRKAVFDWQQFKEVAGIFYGFGKKDSLPEEKPSEDLDVTDFSKPIDPCIAQ